MGPLAGAEAASALPLSPGETATLSYSVDVPALPPKLDFVLLMDTTGSMGGEISNAKSGGGVFFDEVRADSPDSVFAAVSFEDYPYSTYGTLAAGDQPYRRLADLGGGKIQWQTALNMLTTKDGNDVPEAQVPALFAAMTGQSLAWPGGATSSGQGISFRGGAARFIALVSDASFHNDKGSADAYSFAAPTYAETLEELSSGGVRVIAAESNGAAIGADMSGIAADTGGAYTWLNSNGTALWNGAGVPNSPGILGAMRAARYPVTTAVSCAPLDVSLSTASWADVAGETTVSHTQSITVPSGITPAQLPSDRKVDCAVGYTWGEVALAERRAEVEVTFPSAPSTPAAPGTPSNAFTIERSRISSRGTAVLVLDVPGAGALDVLATANVRSKASASRRIRVARVRKTVARAGTVRIKLTPSRRALRILKRSGRLRVAARIIYTPTGGVARTRSKRLTLRTRPRR